MDHNEIFAIAQLYQTAKGTYATDDFKAGFLAGVHYMEILNEERLFDEAASVSTREETHSNEEQEKDND